MWLGPLVMARSVYLGEPVAVPVRVWRVMLDDGCPAAA
jgi:hypothetical protein